MSSKIDQNQVEKAIAALVKHVSNERQKKERHKLIDVEEDYFAVIALKKIPERNRIKPFKVPLPHSLYGTGTKEICLFTKDPQREYKDFIQAAGIKPITKVIGVSKLRNKYKPFETKRALCNAYDLFLADDRILPMLPRLLGNKFFEKKKQPIAVRLSKSKDSLATELTKALNSTTLHLGAGACTSVRFASTTHSPREILENFIAAIDQSAAHIPQNWKNIQSIHIKSSTSIALPVFNSLSSPDDTASKLDESVATTATHGSSTGHMPNVKQDRVSKAPKREGSALNGRKQVSPPTMGVSVKLANSNPEKEKRAMRNSTKKATNSLDTNEKVPLKKGKSVKIAEVQATKNEAIMSGEKLKTVKKTPMKTSVKRVSKK